MRAGTLNHTEVLSLFFFIAQMQIKHIHQLCDRPGQVTDNWADLVTGFNVVQC